MSGVLLIVDDDEWSCWQINEYLGDLGFDMRFTQDCGRAFDMFIKYKPAFIFIDISIHSHDGLWLARSILGMDHKSVIYLMSDHPLAKMRAVRSRLAVADILEKPFDFDRLITMLKPEKRVGSSW